eukprot:TRINITY_DN2400_c0_g2::TRINITY_DN2400_c0_g2_i1::g.20850::m.20850 TRINITY_DN2400_c0_g2::TRINITY_DN2400_c0_g2_i1::g.20850  ORF type:complete len:260 (-),score=32.06,TRAM_LAG1_CLN8/PF03798.11/2e+03,TRAM_LAG1_CLN8/PF03798.11/2.5e-18 TRINITY_DN2400_c0_g2_i1:877-1599(-)
MSLGRLIEFSPHIILFTGSFWVARRCTKVVFAHLPAYSSMSPSRQDRFDLYVLSFLHALIISIACVHKLLFTETNKEEQHYGLLSFLFGYFIHDFWATRQDWIKYPADAYHHLLAISCASAVFMADMQEIQMMLPKYGLLEISTLFLNIAWILREFKIDNAFSAFCTNMFAFLFFVLRIVWFPYCIFVPEFTDPEFIQAIGIVRYILWGAQALQFYWFWLILKKFVLPSKTKTIPEEKLE